MGTDQLLDLFSLENSTKQTSVKQTDSIKGGDKPATTGAVLQQLGDLWDEKQYETEYDLSSFMKSL